MSNNRVTALRNTKTVKEANYWDFSQDNLEVPSSARDITPKWKLFAQYIVNSMESNLQDAKNNFFSDDFFELKFFGELFEPTMVLGSDINMLLILNKYAIKPKNDEQGIWITNSYKTAVTQPTIQNIVQNCNLTIHEIIQNDSSLFREWKVIPREDKNEIHHFTIQHKQFNIIVFPVLKLHDGTFGYIHTASYTLQIWPNLKRYLLITNESNHGLYELIKFCKVLLWDWNSTGKQNIPSIAVDIITYQMCQEDPFTPQHWNDQPFSTLCDAVLSRLEAACKEGCLKAFDNKMLFHGFPCDENSFGSWIQSVKSKPLLDHVESLWNKLSAPFSTSPQTAESRSNSNNSPSSEISNENNSGSSNQWMEPNSSSTCDMENLHQKFANMQIEQKIFQKEDILQLIPDTGITAKELRAMLADKGFEAENCKRVNSLLHKLVQDGQLQLQKEERRHPMYYPMHVSLAKQETNSSPDVVLRNAIPVPDSLQDKLMLILSQHPSGITVPDLHDRFKEQFGTELSPKEINKLVTTELKGKVKRMNPGLSPPRYQPL